MIALAILSTSIAGYFSVSIPTDLLPWYRGIRAIEATLGLVLAVWGIKRRAYSNGPEVDTKPEVPSTSELLKATRSFVDRVWSSDLHHELSHQQAIDFVQMWMSPETSRGRTYETVSLGQDSIRRTCSIHLEPLPGRKGRIWSRASRTNQYVPIARFRRGHLVNNLSIHDRSGRTVSSLPNGEFMVLIGVCVRILTQAAVDFKTAGATKRAYALLLGQCLISRPLSDSETLAQRATEVASILKTTSGVRIRDTVTVTVLCTLIALAQTTYAIVVPAPPGESRLFFELSYDERLLERSQPGGPSAASGSAKKLSAFQRLRTFLHSQYVRVLSGARALLRLRPTTVHVDVSRAMKSDSYHLECKAPDGYYFAAARFYDARTSKRVARTPTPRLYNFEEPYFRCSPPNGGGGIHLYSRGFAGRHDIHLPSLSLRLSEIPPGSTARAWVVSASLLIIIWIIGATPFYTDPNSKDVASASLSSLLFTVPIALIGVLGAASREPDAANLTSRGSLVMSALLALVSLTLDQLMRGGKIPHDAAWPAIAMVTQPIWIVLLVVTLVQTCLVGGRALVRFFKWRRLVISQTAQRLP